MSAKFPSGGAGSLLAGSLSIQLLSSLFLKVSPALNDCKYNWAGPLENVSYVICEQQMRRSACESAQSDQRLCSLLR